MVYMQRFVQRLCCDLAVLFAEKVNFFHTQSNIVTCPLNKDNFPEVRVLKAKKKKQINFYIDSINISQ